MSIKIKVTNEMIREMGDLNYRESNEEVARAVLDIVERDLNASAYEAEFVHVAIQSHGCIEVEG